jgi:hypothetical protein
LVREETTDLLDASYVFDWDGIDFDGTASCAQWKATIAFAFLSAICWLASAILGYESPHPTNPDVL